MSRRTVAPVLLLLAAACSIAAVFAVHRIEARGGPLSEPSAIPPAFSPNGDGIQDEVTIAFTTHQPERVTVDIVAGDGRRVARLLDDEPVDGEVEVAWDGRGARDGHYDVRIRRAGDDRTYAPAGGIVLDTRTPRGVLDRATLEGRQLRGLAMLHEGEEIVVTTASGRDLGEHLRAFRPRSADAASARPTRPAPPGTKPVRFLLDLPAGALPVQVYVEDAAGNRRSVNADVLARPAR